MLLTRVKIQFLDRKERNKKKELKRKNSSLLQLDRSVFFSFETGRTNFFPPFFLSSRNETRVKFGNFFTNIVWKYWSTDSKKLENPCIIFLPEQFSRNYECWTAEFLPEFCPRIYFPFSFFLSITLKKICFPIDAKRFPIDGDMQIVEFLYAPGHFSFTRTKASPLLLPRKRRNFPLPVESGQDLNIIVGRSNYFSIGKISKLGHAAIVP